MGGWGVGYLPISLQKRDLQTVPLLVKDTVFGKSISSSSKISLISAMHVKCVVEDNLSYQYAKSYSLRLVSR